MRGILKSLVIAIIVGTLTFIFAPNFVGLVLLYFLPSLIAARNGNKHQNKIFLTNLFFGWTILGWIGCLIWAVK